MKRVNFDPTLLDIDPQSLAKVFMTIDSFTNLDQPSLKNLKDLKVIMDDFSFSNKEKYYILYYLREHLNSKNSSSFIYRQFAERKFLASKYSESSEEIEDFEIWQTSLLVGFQEIRNFCINLLPEYKRLYKNSSDVSVQYTKYEELFEQIALKIYKLPLIIPSLKKDGSIVDLDMRPVIESKLKDLVSKPDIDVIIRNTFNYKLQSPPHLLNIASDKIGDIRNAFYEIYLIYKMELDNLKNKENSALKVLKDKYLNEDYNKRDFLIDYFDLKDELHVKKFTNKMNFARIIFVSFAQVREKYISSAIENNLYIDHFINENICKNLKKRK